MQDYGLVIKELFVSRRSHRLSQILLKKNNQRLLFSAFICAICGRFFIYFSIALSGNPNSSTILIPTVSS